MSPPTDDPNGPISEFHKDLQHSQAKPETTGRSVADDVIEAIGGFGSVKVRKKGACPACGGASVTTNYPVGGAARNICQSCAHKWLGGPKSIAPLVLAKVGEPGSAAVGPFYKGGPALSAAQDPNQPTARRKAKSLNKIKGE